MRFILTCILALLGSQCANAQVSLNAFITEFADKHNLYTKELTKLEALRLEMEDGTIDSKAKWQQQFAKWDKHGVTNSICIENILSERFMGFKACTDASHATATAHFIGYPLKYFFSRADRAQEQSKLSNVNLSIVKNLLVAQAQHDDLILKDVEHLDLAYNEHFKTAPITYAQLNQLVNYVASDSSEEMSELIDRIKYLRKADFQKIEDYLNENGLSYNDLLFSLYETQNRFHPQLSFVTSSLPSISFSYASAAGKDFNDMMYGESNLSMCREFDSLKFEPFMENKTIRNVALFKLIFDKWYEFELEEFERSSTHKYLTKNEFISNPWHELLFFEEQFLSTEFAVLFKVSEKSIFEQLLISAYNDVYFRLRFRQEKSILAEKIDVLQFDLTDQQRAIVEALLEENAEHLQARLKKAVVGLSWDGVETERSFLLACCIVFDQKANSIQRDWNQSAFYTNPFGSDSDNGSIAIPSVDPAAFEKLKIAMIDKLEKAHYAIGTYAFSWLRPLTTTATHGVQNGLVTEFMQKLDDAEEGRARIPYTRIAIATKQKLEIPPKKVSEDQNENPFGNGSSGGGSYQPKKEVAPPPPPIAMNNNSVKIQAEIVDFPEVVASFPGGVQALNIWIKENLQYPEISKELGDQGRVYVTFVVELDGSLTTIEVLRGGVTNELNHEAKRLIRNMPKWTPAEVRGEKVRSRCRVPITFTLGMDD